MNSYLIEYCASLHCLHPDEVTKPQVKRRPKHVDEHIVTYSETKRRGISQWMLCKAAA